jgi:hypothetical protein
MQSIAVPKETKKAAVKLPFPRYGQSGLSAAAVLLAEALDAARGIDHLLLAGPERMAFGTHFNVQRRLGERRLRRESIAARASDLDFFVIRMDFGFHGVSFAVPVNVAGYIYVTVNYHAGDGLSQDSQRLA